MAQPFGGSWRNYSYAGGTMPVDYIDQGPPSTKSGIFGMDPLTLGLGVAGIGASLFGANRAAQAQQDMADAQLAAAASQQAFAARTASDAAKAKLGEGLAARTFQTWAPELDLDRQLRAKRQELGPLAELKRASEMGFGRAKLGLEGSQEAKKLRQEENKRRLKEKFAERQAQMAGMFGRIAPQDVSTYFV
jgi:hypothetical protein